ncbi:Uncharacterized protein OBRU01_14013 [Operophtera brumata]|uniref:Alpha-carbonic anhydrase domain-containing protein n=1 Tax=Operophtera brumata TaxID=104452 RepID=A0A0L7L7J6_OPEBR|nr:Uncharacterized protein OBRU01_14013 [Operophtera brumata]
MSSEQSAAKHRGLSTLSKMGPPAATMSIPPPPSKAPVPEEDDWITVRNKKTSKTSKMEVTNRTMDNNTKSTTEGTNHGPSKDARAASAVSRPELSGYGNSGNGSKEISSRMEAGDRNDGREYDEPRKETFCEFAQKNEVKNSNDRLLDLVLVSSEMDEVHVCIADEVLVLVDQQHPPLAVTVRRCARAESGPAPPTLPPLTTLSSWDFSKADYHALYSTVAAVDWSTLYRVQEPEEALDCFYAALNDIFNECIPKKRIRKVNSRHIYPRWYTVEIIREIQHKARLHKLYKAKGSKVNYQAFSESRARVKEMIIAEHKRHLERVQSRLVEDPKTFWEYVREKRGAVNRKKITKDGNTLPESECAQEFANYFLSVYGTSAAVLDVNEAELSSRAGIKMSGIWNASKRPVIYGGAAHSRRYIFDSISLHWPSEHTINGLHYPIESQALYVSAEYGSVEEAQSATCDKMSLLGVASLYKKLIPTNILDYGIIHLCLSP